MKIYKNGILICNWLLVYNIEYKVNKEDFKKTKDIFQIRLRKLKKTKTKNIFKAVKTITLFKYKYD